MFELQAYFQKVCKLLLTVTIFFHCYSSYHNKYKIDTIHVKLKMLITEPVIQKTLLVESFRHL